MIDVQAVGGAKNLRIAIHIQRRPRGRHVVTQGVAFTLTPKEAVALADKLNAVLDDPNTDEAAAVTRALRSSIRLKGK